MSARLKIVAASASLMITVPACADPAAPGPRAGDSSEIRLSYKTDERSTDGSGSTNGQDTILERVVAVTPDGIEYEYDLPTSASAADRKKQWFFPAQVFRPSSGPAQLRNAPELEVRLDEWLASAKWTREMCGRWIFTWNAFQIVCDPNEALDAVEPFDLWTTRPSDGASLTHPTALASGTIKRTASGDRGTTYVAEFAINPEVIRKQRAEADVVVGEITGKPVTLQSALDDHATEQIAGTIRITFETDVAGNVLSRTTETSLETSKPDGASETSRRTETVERVGR